MIKHILVIAGLVAIALAAESNKSESKIFCPFPFISAYNGYSFNNCYYYNGVQNSYLAAAQLCSNMGTYLVTAKDSSVLSDLYNLYKAFPNFYFWVGATSSPLNPTYFRWQDGTPVSSNTFCKGHPKGGNNLCAFYTTTAIIGRDQCISTGECTSSFFDHGAICQYGY